MTASDVPWMADDTSADGGSACADCFVWSFLKNAAKRKAECRIQSPCTIIVLKAQSNSQEKKSDKPQEKGTPQPAWPDGAVAENGFYMRTGSSQNGLSYESVIAFV